MENDDQISKLLRLKRYEHPPEGYFDRFLEEFQERQRTELIRRPILSILWERICSFVPDFEVPRLAYAAVAACAVLGAVAVVGGPETGSLASRTATPAAESLSLASTKAPTIGAPAPVMLASAPSPAVHYVLPTRPVSYASSTGF